METQQITDSAQPSNPRAWLRRLVGASKPYGAEYEFKLAGLLALRARRRKLRFQVFTNVSAARPCDDIVFRVLGEEPATVFVQLKHANEDTPTKATKIAGQAFTSPKGDFSLKKYFAFYAAFSQKQSAAPDSLRKDERLLCACAMRDVRFVLFTNRSVVRAAGAADAPHLPFCHEEVFNTAPAAATGPVKVFSFGDADADVWNIYKNQPENQVYQEEFLPRLRVFSEQVHTNDLDCLIKMELDMVFGAPLPRTDQFLSGYVAFLRSWALDDDQGYALSNSSGELEELLAKERNKSTWTTILILANTEGDYYTSNISSCASDVRCSSLESSSGAPVLLLSVGYDDHLQAVLVWGSIATTSNISSCASDVR